LQSIKKPFSKPVSYLTPNRPATGLAANAATAREKTTFNESINSRRVLLVMTEEAPKPEAKCRVNFGKTLHND